MVHRSQLCFDVSGDGLEAILRVLSDGKKGEPFVAEHLAALRRLQTNNVKMALFPDRCAIWMNAEASPRDAVVLSIGVGRTPPA